MSYSSGTTSCLVQSAVRNISLTSGRHYPWGRLSCVWLSGELVRVGRGFMQENLLQVGPARDSNSRVPVRGADRSRHSGVGEQRGGGCRCAPATCRGGAPSGRRLAARTARDRLCRWWTGDSAPKASVASASRYGGGSARGKVVGGVAWAGCMARPRTHTNLRNVKRGRGPRARWAWSRERADASGARVGRRGGLDAGLVRSGPAERAGGREEGWAPWRSLGQRSNLGAAGGAHLSVTAGAGTGTRRE